MLSKLPAASDLRPLYCWVIDGVPHKYYLLVLISLIVIVAFARKSSIQQVVSVEDFWGGVFTGFLVGYTGEEFIKSVLCGTTAAPQ